MGITTEISWATSTFNPWIGCTKVSAGCANCYAERDMDHRRKRVKWGAGQARSRTSTSYWRQPLAWNREAAKSGEPWRVFCASLADWLDPEVPAEWLCDLLTVIAGPPRGPPHPRVPGVRRDLWMPRLPEAPAQCASCPFREGNDAEFGLIVRVLRTMHGLTERVTRFMVFYAREEARRDADRRGDFACHLTTVYDIGNGRMKPASEHRQCPGASAIYRAGPCRG